MSTGILWANTLEAGYIALFVLSAISCLGAIPRARNFDNPHVRAGLIGLLATTGLWALFKIEYFILPGEYREVAYTIGLISGFATVWAWLYFCSAYTGRTYHKNPTLLWLGASVFFGVVAIKATNPLHGLYFSTTEVMTPFPHLAIEHGVLHWSATGLSYILAAIGLFVLFEFFAQSGYDTRPLMGLTVLLAIPVGLDFIALTTPRLIDIIYAPFGVAAFAVGVLFVFEQRFAAVQASGTDNSPAIYVDENGVIRDYSSAAETAFPELTGATGEQLAVVLPSVAATFDTDDQIVEYETGNETRYYVASLNDVAVSDSTVQVVVLSDVTDLESQRRTLVRREQELAERNELYRAVIAATSGFIIRITRDGKISYVSESVEEYLGYSVADLDGVDLTFAIPDEQTATKAESQLQEVLEGEALEIRNFPLQTKTGRTINTDVRAVPIYEASVPPTERTKADIVGAQVMVRDTTDRQQREGLISVINRVLRHNVRNKLTVITGYADLLSEELDGEQEANANQIRVTANQLLELAESARRIEKNRDLSPELERVEMTDIVAMLLDRLEERFPDATVTADLPETAPAASLPRIETALWELLENAGKHGGDAAAVKVKVTETEYNIVIEIADDGPGLPESERKVLTTGTEEPLVHGQGLGLYLAYWIIRNLKGEIDVKTQDGTSVFVKLPKATVTE